MDQSCDLCFEYATVKAEIHSVINSVKNPRSGIIIAKDFGEIIIDENVKEPNNCQIKKWNDDDNNVDEKKESRKNNNHFLISE